MTSGEKLIKTLKLEKFKYIYAHRIINAPIQILILTVNSRYPHIFLIPQQVKKNTSMLVRRFVSYNSPPQDYHMSYPIELKYYTENLNVGSLIIINDLAGHYYGNPRMFESYVVKNDTKLKKLNEKFIKI